PEGVPVAAATSVDARGGRPRGPARIRPEATGRALPRDALRESPAGGVAGPGGGRVVAPRRGRGARPPDARPEARRAAAPEDDRRGAFRQRSVGRPRRPAAGAALGRARAADPFARFRRAGERRRARAGPPGLR